ncbi:hypothetical protein FS749_000307 [Ceratobasidium sp. UAMH 11750]|nr:hypothetical protein FS749_000307 [Ceratobasidium sp. UAMH 11750]
MPASSNNNQPSTQTESGYSLHGKQYTYSRSKAPAPKPPESGKRPAVPPSAAGRKRQRRAITTASDDSQSVPHAETSVGSVPTENEQSQPQPSGETNTEDSGARPSEPSQTPVRARTQGNPRNPQTAIPEGQTRPDTRESHATPAQPLRHEHVQQTPTRRVPDIEVVQATPDRFVLQTSATANYGSFGVPNPPAPAPEDSHLLMPFMPQSNFFMPMPDSFMIQSDPFMAQPDSFLSQPDLFMAQHNSFAAQSGLFAAQPDLPIPQFNPPLGFSLGTQHLNTSGGSSYVPQSPAPNRQLFGDTQGVTRLTGLTKDVFAVSTHPPETAPVTNAALAPRTGQPTSTPIESNNDPGLDNPGQLATGPPQSPLESAFAPQTLVSRDRDMNLKELHSAILHSLPPRAVLWQLAPSPASVIVPLPAASSQSAQLAPSSRANSVQPPSRGPSPIPSRSATPVADMSNNEDELIIQRKLRERQFSDEHHAFVQPMKIRWHWFLLTEDPFPVDTNKGIESCLAYAEQQLGDSRHAYKVNLRVCNYVRGKESRIRNEFQNGVLAKVEQLYNVSPSKKDAIKELVQGYNFIFMTFKDPHDPQKMTGRYQHSCIGEVLKLLIFPHKTRGKPVGARFMYELLDNTPAEEVSEFVDRTANYGAPVPTIALACTLIMYAFELLQKGYSSRNPTQRGTRKTLSLEGGTYGEKYRKILGKLKNYDRLGELRRFHMRGLLLEYNTRYVDGARGGSVNDEEEYERRYSDGE